MRCFTISSLVPSSRFSFLSHLFIFLIRRLIWHNSKVWDWPCLCVLAFLLPWLWKRVQVALLPVVLTWKQQDIKHNFEKRGFKIKPYKPENSIKVSLGSEGRDSMKLYLSPQLNILIGNHRYSNKGEILFCETWSQTLPISVQCVPPCRESCVTQSKPDLTKSWQIPPLLFLLPLLLSFLCVIHESQQRCTSLHCMKTWPLRHNGEANKGQCCPETFASRGKLQLPPKPRARHASREAE